jgi:hypothetical protein
MFKQCVTLSLSHAHTYTHTHTHTHAGDLPGTCRGSGFYVQAVCNSLSMTHSLTHIHTHTHTRRGPVGDMQGSRFNAQAVCREGLCSLLPQLNCLHQANIVRGEDASNVAAIAAQKQATCLKEVNRVPVELHIAVQCFKRRGNG